MNDNKCSFAHGKGVGGSSILNNMIYSRGNKRDFDDWEKNGNIGWSYDDVLPFFKKSEKSSLQYSSQSFHGKEGELPVEDVPFRWEFDFWIFVYACVLISIIDLITEQSYQESS